MRPRRTKPMYHPSGVTLVEVSVTLFVLCLLTSLCIPITLQVRESARSHQCRNNLKELGLALHNYHDVFRTLPPAAIWSVDATVSLALYESRQIDRLTHANWAQFLLPYLNQTALMNQFDTTLAIGANANAEARMTPLAEMKCPVDRFHTAENMYAFRIGEQEVPRRFARGNYGINGGSQNSQMMQPTTAAARGEVGHIVIQENPRQFQMWGNGIAGINKSFSLNDFENGLGTLVALEELRAGVHPSDPRGVWALGQIGGSITWAHGVQGDASQPNSQFFRSDDLLGCGELHAELGSVQLEKMEMPCCHYVDRNAQAAARSMHPGGVHVALMDGSVRFIGDRIDAGLWHVMHSRETPQQVLAHSFDRFLMMQNFPDQLEHRFRSGDVELLFDETRMNSIGMTFVELPAGEFIMGIPDHGNSFEPPVEVPEHLVRLNLPILMSVHEVTQAQFALVMDDADNREKRVNKEAGDPSSLPVVDVTWDQAVQFCKRLSDLPAEKQARREYRLPTEAEWEYGCRSGKSNPYHWKKVRSTDDNTGEAAGTLPALPLAPVGSYPANAFGLHDMRGNAWEWCSDWFDRDYYSRSPIENPQGPQQGFLKVVRGGDWRFIGEPCRHDYSMLPPWKKNPVVGFRVVCVSAPGVGEQDTKAH